MKKNKYGCKMHNACEYYGSADSLLASLLANKYPLKIIYRKELFKMIQEIDTSASSCMS